MRKLTIKGEKKQIFILFFVFYIFLGLCISYTINFDTNLFFGADNARVFFDLTDIQYNHYRMKVHPLFLIFTEPIVLILNGFVNNKGLSVIILESFIGACSIVFLFCTLKELEIEDKLIKAITLLYGFSFSMMMFSSIPETFIFAGLGLIYYWYFVLKVSKKMCSYHRSINILLVIFGVINFGMTLTNYMSYIC